jgi:hypothetical protein
MRVVALVLLVGVGASTALAQGNQGAEDLSQKGGGAGESSQAQSAHVGAGTVDGTTNGFSQPPKPAGGGGPAKLEASLCDQVKDEPAHGDCLSKVLGTGAQP